MSTQEKETTSFEEMLDRNGYLAYTNVGTSMMPLLRQGKDVMEIRKKEPERCKKYDAVLYKVNDRYILHRIIKVRENDYVMRTTLTARFPMNGSVGCLQPMRQSKASVSNGLRNC